jgi:subtilisin-like proprotein convertase family protein/photosystem II stability/assembly factor-like uncharacterized protein
MRSKSFASLFDVKNRSNNRRRHVTRPASRIRGSSLLLERLEDRTVMAIPGAKANLPGIIGVGQTRDNFSSPSIAVNPINPQRMVSAFVRNCDIADCPDPLQKVYVEAVYSKNGGQTWESVDLPDPLLDPDTLDDPQPRAFPYATDVSVGWNRQNQIYFVYSQHTEDFQRGALVLHKFGTNTFGDIDAVATIANSRIYTWKSQSTDSFGIGRRAALNPTMAVDNNVPSYTDPQTGWVQSDPNSGTVYVAWNTNDEPPSNPPFNFNPYSIALVASSDGGLSFSSPVMLNNNAGGTGPRHAAPRITISQGTSTPPGEIPVVKGGQVTVVWDDFGQEMNPPPGLDNMLTRRFANGGAGSSTFCKPQIMYPPVDDCGDINHPAEDGQTASIEFSLAVNLNPTTFGANVQGISVSLAIDSDHLPAMKVTLFSPSGAPFVLFENNEDEQGNSVPGRGVTNSPMGVIPFGEEEQVDIPWYTVFNENALLAINSLDAQNIEGYLGTFQPEGSLPMTPFPTANANGTWKLRIETFRPKGEEEVSKLVNWGISFAGRLEFVDDPSDPDWNPVVDIDPFSTMPGLRGGPALGDYIFAKPNYAPEAGVGPSPVIASHNTLGSFDPFQGRLYIAYVTRPFANQLPNNTDIPLFVSDDGGLSWSFESFINDDVAEDGFSRGVRPQILPSLAFDTFTGTLVASFLDFRYDPAERRYVNTVTASLDGGGSWNKQVWLNLTQTATDSITGKQVIIEPIPDNQSNENDVRDQLYNMGDRQGLAAINGKIFAVWPGNLNGGRDPDPNNSANQDTWQRQVIFLGTATFQAGPSIVNSTMGPAQAVNVSGFEFNNTFNAQGLPLVDGFAVVFDRRVDPGTFTTASVQVKYRSSDPLASFVDIPVDQVIPLNTNFFGATSFFIHFTNPQISTGTYSYVILPNIRDRMRKPAGTLGTSGCPTASFVLGNCMDQNINSVVGEPSTGVTGGDSYAAPTPRNNGPNFLAPYDSDTLPIIVPGPYIAKTNVAGNPLTPDNVVLNKTVSSIDITFDRDMRPETVIPSAILRMHGPAGNIAGPFTVTPNPLGSDPDPSFPRTYRIGFPAQILSGTYTITLNSTVAAKGGKLLDTEKDAGLDILFQKPTAGTEPKLYANGTDVFIGPNSSAFSAITVPDNFVIQSLTIGNANSPGFDINFPDVRFLSARLVAPDGTEIKLFTKPGSNFPPPHSDVKGTILDDNATKPTGGTNPIQEAAAPFDGRFNPQQPLSVLNGKLSAGTYRLIITNESGHSGVLQAWSIVLQKAISQTGLGEPVADQAAISFRIFNADKKLPIAQQTWTAVGPAANNNNTSSSRIGGIAVDPSDPSGNTVYVAGASGGVWKTTNFMTSSPIGPTWLPLTDFGPIFSINIGGIALFPRNNDPKQTMIFVSTGEGDTRGSLLTGIGAGIMRSMDAGLTWTQLDSTDNTKPFAQRDHRFRSASSFKIFVDPKPSPVGPNEAVVYAVIDGADSASELTVQGGIWKSVDSGKHWFRLTPAPNQTGFANPTDLVFVPSSADAVTGNLRLAYASWRGKGVYISSNGGSGWTQLLGGVGNPLIRDPVNDPIPVTDPPDTPNGDKGRIVLATPHLSGSKAQDLSYQGWVYAYVVNTDGLTNGLYVSKDFGQNWTKVKLGISTVGVAGDASSRVYADLTPAWAPSNDDLAPDLEQMSNNQGNYDISIAVNVEDPNIIYIGGAAPENIIGGTVIRVDLTGLADPHNLTAFNNFRNDGGRLWFETIGSITLQTPNEGRPYGFPPTSVFPDLPYVNLFRDPNSPFANPSTLNVGNPALSTLITGWTNTGIRAAYAPWYGIGGQINGVDQHEVVAFPDPLTGHTRLIFGYDQGLSTLVEREDGTFSAGVGTYVLPSGPRSGNLQINQFYGGATQPSQSAADKGGSMFYGAAQDNGWPSSDKDILKNGNLGWTGDFGDASWVATDQTGSGTVFHWKWPCCGGNDTDTFTVNNIGKTVGLFQAATDPQWPDGGDCCRFAVNPINPDQVVIISDAGRVFRTGGLPGGYTWFVIGEPQSSGGPFDNIGGDALAFGAPDPSDPTLQTDNHIWIGNRAGNVFVTFDGGGHWLKFGTAEGLDGSPVQAIVTNPKRGTHEAYVVTYTGVFWMQDAAKPGAQFVEITGNLFDITHTPFGVSDLTETRLKIMTSLVADWRYSILDNPNQPNGLTHPILYVGGMGGVYRSLDKGQTWTTFPNIANDGAPVKGGYLPNAFITRLELSLGNVNPETGFPDPKTSEDMLVAHTYGRGSFMIRLKELNPIEQAFVRGLDNQIYAQRLDANGNPVSGYFLTAGGQFKSFITGRTGNKLPELFAIGFDNQIYAQKFDGSGASMGPWFLTAGGAFQSIAVGNIPSGAPQLFAVGFDSQLYALKFNLDGNPIGSFFATQHLPVGVKQIFVGHDTIRRAQVFAVGFDNQVYFQKFGRMGNSASTWILASPGQVKSVTVAQDASGRPETFVIGLDDNVYYQKFDSNGFPIGTYAFLGFKQVSKIVPAHDALNNPEIFVLGFDQTVYGHRFDANGNPIGGGYFLAAPGQVKNLDVGFDLNNNPELFVIGLDDQIYYATFFPTGLPASNYKLLNPGKFIGLKVTK